MVSTSHATAAELTPEAIAAWNRHVARVEASLPMHEHDGPLAEPEGRTIDVPGAAIHEWRGSILIHGVTVPQIVDALLSPGPKPLQEDVAESRVLERHGDSLRIYLKLVRKVIVAVTYDTEHDVQYVRRSPEFATSRSVATKIVESGGADRGFLWRLNSYWRYRRVGDKVQVDVLSLSLSRDVPRLVKPIAHPIINRIGRESMSRTLYTIERRANELPRRALEHVAKTHDDHRRDRRNRRDSFAQRSHRVLRSTSWRNFEIRSSFDFVTSASRIRPATAAQANDSERRVARVSREIASKAPEIAAGRQRSRDLRESPTGRARTGAPARHPRWGGDAISPAVSRVSGAVVSGRIPAM